MSCDRCAKQCERAAQAAGVPQADAEWSAGRQGAGHCPKCGGFLTEGGQCNSPRHNWVSQLDQEARLFGTTARNILEEDPRFDDPNFMPQGSPGAFMAQVGRDYLRGDDAPTPADTLESLVDEYEEAMGDKAVNNPVYLDAIRVLNDESVTERDIHPVMKAMAEAYRKDADPEIAAESDALQQADEILAAREKRKIKRTTVSVAPPVKETPEAKLRGQLQKLLTATEPYKDQFTMQGRRDTAKRALQSGVSPRVAWNALHSLNLGHGDDDTPNSETDNTTDVLAQTGGELWGKPLPDDAYQSGEEARAASMWMTELTSPLNTLDTGAATAAVSHVIGFSKNKMWTGDYLSPNDASALMRSADWSQIGPENTGRFFETYYGMTWRSGDTVSQEKILGAMIKNPTTPPELLNGRFPMLANQLKSEQVAALVAHPNFGKFGQEALMRSPKPTVRKVLAESERTHPDVLKTMIKDPSRNVALAALRNNNQPLAGAVEAGRKSGIADTQLLSQMQNKTRTWRDTPRCSVCAAWTKADGVCSNSRCGAKGQKTAEAKRWPPVGTPNLGMAIADDIYAKLNRDYGKRDQFKNTRDAWAEAMQSKITPPKEWRGAIAEGVTQLVAVGEYEVANGRRLAWNEQYGTYTLNGIPVQADNAGQAIRTTLKMMAMQEDRAVSSLASQLGYGKQQLVVGDKVLQFEKKTGIYSVYDLASSAAGGEPIHQRPAPEDPKRPDYAAERIADEEAVKKFFTAEGVPYYRYSPGMRQMVLQTETEPTPIATTAPIESTGLTSNPIPPKLSNWGTGDPIRPGLSNFSRNNITVSLHNADSPGYVNFVPGEGEQVLPAAEMKRAAKALGSMVGSPAYRPALSRVWGFSDDSKPMATTAKQHGFNPGNGYWIATDGFRLALVTSKAPIKAGINIDPDMAKLAADAGKVRFGAVDTNGNANAATFDTKDGYHAEASWDASQTYPDVNQIIPTKQQTADWPAFEITQKVPKELIKANNVKLGRLYHEGGKLFMRVTLDADRKPGDKTPPETRVLEIGKMTGQNHHPEYEGHEITAVNMQYFNDMLDVAPGGSWMMKMQGMVEYDTPPSYSSRQPQQILRPIIFTHNSNEAMGLVMPMHVNP